MTRARPYVGRTRSSSAFHGDSQTSRISAPFGNAHHRQSRLGRCLFRQRPAGRCRHRHTQSRATSSTTVTEFGPYVTSQSHGHIHRCRASHGRPVADHIELERRALRRGSPWTWRVSHTWYPTMLTDRSPFATPTWPASLLAAANTSRRSRVYTSRPSPVSGVSQVTRRSARQRASRRVV